MEDTERRVALKLFNSEHPRRLVEIEGCNGKNGWAFSGKGNDEGDAEAVYELLEKEIIPLFYKVDDGGIPRGWVKVMKGAIKSTAPLFSERRMVKEYASFIRAH